MFKNVNLQIIYLVRKYNWVEITSSYTLWNIWYKQFFNKWKEHFDFWFDLNDVSKVALKCLFDHQHAPVNILKKNTKAENRIYFIRVKCYVIFCWKIFRKKIWTHIYLCPFFLFASKLLGFASSWQKVKKRCRGDVFEKGFRTKYLVYVLFQINYMINYFYIFDMDC